MFTVILIARKDILELIRDRRFTWVGGILVLLFVVSLAVGLQYQREVRTRQKIGAEASYRNWLAQGEKNPHQAAHYGMYVYKPAPVLALIDPGIDPYVGVTIWLAAHERGDSKFRPVDDATGLERFGRLSAGWVLQVLAPLLIIVLGFNLISGEREQGTLRQCLSMGVSPFEILVGKVLSLGGAVLLLMTPIILLYLSMLFMRAEGGDLAESVLCCSWMALGYTLYLAIFIFLAVAVSARTSTRAALVLLLAYWVMNAVLAPRIASDSSRLYHPAPSSAEFVSAINKDSQGEWKPRERELLELYGVSRIDDMPERSFGTRIEAHDEVSFLVLDRQYGRLWETFEKQRAFQELGGVFAPLLAIQSFSMAMAGSDFAHYRDFVAAAEKHRRLISTMMNTFNIEGARDEGLNFKAGKELWQAVPPFAYHLPSTAWAMGRSWPSVVILAGGVLISFSLAFIAVCRHKERLIEQ